MLIQRINRSDPEKVFIVVKNTSTTTAITVGQAVVFDYVTDADGVGVTRPVTAVLNMPAGIVETASIAAGDYGLVQVYGHNANALVDGSSTCGVGSILTLKNNSYNLLLLSTAEDTFAEPASMHFVAGEAYSTGAAAAKKVFVRCL